MKAGWEKSNLAKVCEFVRGPFGGSLKKACFVEEGFAVFEQQHAIYDRFDDIRYFIDAEKFSEMKRFELRPGDLIMSCSGTMGRVSIAPRDLRKGIINQALLKISPKHCVDGTFLKLWMESPNFQEALLEHSGGAAIQNVASVKILKGISLELPPLDEQRRIVAVLDKAFAGIATATANAQKNLTNARALFESYVQSFFAGRSAGWTELRFDQICENLDNLRRPVTKSVRTAGEIPYYGASGQVDSVADYLFDENLLLVSEDGANLLMRTYPIAFSISGKSWVNNHAHVLRFSDRDTQSLVEYYLNSISLAPYVSGMAQPKLNQKSLNGIPIPLPPADQRAESVAKLGVIAQNIQALEDNLEAKLAELAELKQSLLQKAFAGELT